MTDRELMQMALDAFEWNYNTDLDNIPDCNKWLTMMMQNITALRERLAQPEPEPSGYAGVSIWIGEHRITQLLTKIQLEREIVPGMSITETARRCLDMIAKAMGKNT